jgi:hypothetical protein
LVVGGNGGFDDPDNDFWLIYAYDDFRDEYLLLTITGPDAHSREQWGSYLRNVHIGYVTKASGMAQIVKDPGLLSP